MPVSGKRESGGADETAAPERVEERRDIEFDGEHGFLLHCPAGGEAVVIGVVNPGVAARMPSEIAGVPVVVEVTVDANALPQD